MTRKINQEGLEAIKRWEGLRLRAYRPISHDVLTIGYGHTSSAGEPHVYEGMAITEEEAEEILGRDLGKFESAVEALVKVPLNNNQFTALVSLCMNIGVPAFSKSTLLKKLNSSDYVSAQQEFSKWRKSGGKVVNGLVNRRAQEAALFGKGEHVSSSYVDVKAAAPKIITKENVAIGATVASSAGHVFVGTGPVQMALAVIMVLGFSAWLFLEVRKRLNPA